jgi:hypothetical protein
MSCSILALISFSGAYVTTSLNQFDRFWATQRVPRLQDYITKMVDPAH